MKFPKKFDIYLDYLFNFVYLCEYRCFIKTIMMKRFFTLLILAGLMMLVSCNKNEESFAWKELPTAPLSGENAQFTVNGDAMPGGTAQLTATSSTEGILLLTNVLPGYGQISMDVTLSERPDGAFDIHGEKALDKGPSMLPKSNLKAPAVFNISVEGNIAPEGKVSIDLTSELTSEAQGGLTGKWNLLTKLEMSEDGSMLTAPLWFTWNAKDKEQPNGEQLAMTLRTFGSPLLCQVLNSVTFSADGNITAQYWSGELDLMTAIFGGLGEDENGNTILVNTHPEEPWLESPKNMAFWYTRGEYIYIVPNISAIIGEAGSEGTGSIEDLTNVLGALGDYGLKIESLLPLITKWMETGIEMKYEKTAGGLKLYADKEMCRPVIEVLLPALPELDKLIAKLIAENPDDEMIQMLPMIFYMIGIENFAAIGPIWENNTAEFEMSLNFTGGN